VPALAQRVARDRQQLCLPLADDPMAYLGPTQLEELAQIARRLNTTKAMMSLGR
jgi:hypothetical protein